MRGSTVVTDEDGVGGVERDAGERREWPRSGSGSGRSAAQVPIRKRVHRAWFRRGPDAPAGEGMIPDSSAPRFIEVNDVDRHKRDTARPPIIESPAVLTEHTVCFPKT